MTAHFDALLPFRANVWAAELLNASRPHQLNSRARRQWASVEISEALNLASLCSAPVPFRRGYRPSEAAACLGRRCSSIGEGVKAVLRFDQDDNVALFLPLPEIF